MDQIRVTFLGTGAGTPSRDRNVSSVALSLDGTVLLFDCGEGTQQQLLRSAVRTGAIAAIFLTHLHGDHVYGLPGLLATLSLNGRDAPLAVYGPKGTAAFVEAIRATTQWNLTYPLHVTDVDGDDGRPVYLAGGYSVIAAPLDHTIPSLGFCVLEDPRPGTFNVQAALAFGVPAGPLFARLQQGEDVALDDGRIVRSCDVVGPPRRGRRIAFCGDTRPCAASVTLAYEGDLLIHEATYGSELQMEASARGHSTAADAARVAREAQVRKLVLTHFSPRYIDIEPLLSEARAIHPDTEAASDFLVVPVHRD